MDLPKAEDLRALLAAARECGVTRLKLDVVGGIIEAELSTAPPAARASAEAPDPMDVIRRQAAAGNRQPAVDLLDLLASGARIIPPGNPDPTAPT